MGSFTGTAIDRLRLEAKRLLKDIRRGDAAALQRVTAYWPASGPSGEVRNLARTQLVIARERGYRSRAHLKTSLLGNEERVMSEEKNTTVTDYRRGYSYKDVGILLGIADVGGKYFVPVIGGFIIYTIMVAVLIFRFDKPDEAIGRLQEAGINVIDSVEVYGGGLPA